MESRLELSFDTSGHAFNIAFSKACYRRLPHLTSGIFESIDGGGQKVREGAQQIHHSSHLQDLPLSRAANNLLTLPRMRNCVGHTLFLNGLLSEKSASRAKGLDCQVLVQHDLLRLAEQPIYLGILGVRALTSCFPTLTCLSAKQPRTEG